MVKDILHLGILHYHWRTGGVRTVVSNSLRALVAHGRYPHMAIDLISSDAKQPAGMSLLNQCQNRANAQPSRNISCHPIEIPELAYNDRPAASRDAFLYDAQHLCEQLLAALPLEGCSAEMPYILHGHNLNLGKNPRLTAAIKLLAERAQAENLPLVILHQMHDFAEDNRPACWNALRDCTGSENREFAVEIMYPCSPRIIWGCINSRDQQRLSNIGLPPERIHLITNAIDTETFTAAVTTMTPEQLIAQGLEPLDYPALLQNQLADYAKKHGFIYDSRRRLLLAPFKAIRRKNITELVLLLLHANAREDCYQLVITLNPTSSDDARACEQLERLVKRYHLPVVIGLGEMLGGHDRTIGKGRVEQFSLADLIGLGDAVVTTSIQEGFGYVFHEPWPAGKPLLGRDIPEITCDFTAAGMNLDHLYNHLFIPISWLGDREYEGLQLEYYHKQQRLSASMHHESPDSQAFETSFKQTKIHYLSASDHAGHIDWADLSFDLQLFILEVLIAVPAKLSNIVFSKQTPDPPCNWHILPDAATIEANRRVVLDHFGLARHSEQVEGLYRHMATLAGRHVPAPRIDNQLLLQHSLELEKLHLLV